MAWTILADWHLAEAYVALCEDHISRFLVTKFPDGSEVLARPVHGEWIWFHDLLHSALAAYLGWDHSPTLWRNAHPGSSDVADDNLVAYEEAAVLALQRVLIDQSGVV